MTNLCLKIYRFFKAHNAAFWAAFILSFLIVFAVGSRIHLEEDLNKLMPSSKNADGTTKLAFADLKIKDKVYLLFEGDDTDSLIAACDAFTDSLKAIDPEGKMVSDIFCGISDELLPELIDYLYEHLPSYIDSTVYAKIDTMLTPQRFRAVMRQNREDLEGDFGEAYPEYIEADPLGLRNILAQGMLPAMTGDTSDEASEDASANADDQTSGNADAQASDEALKESGGSPAGGYTIIDGHFFTKDSTVCIAFLTPAFSATNTGEGSALFEVLNKLISSYPLPAKISYHGTPASGFYNASTIKHDLIFMVGGALIVVLLFLYFCFRKFSYIIYMLIPVLFGTFFGLAVMYLIKGELSLLALGIGSVVLGVALSYSLHVITHYAYTQNAERVIKDETTPVMLGCITTIGSFIGILFIHTDLLRDFGLFAAFAILGTTLFSLFFLPKMLEGTKVSEKKDDSVMPAAIEKLCQADASRNKPLLCVIAVLTIVCLVAFFIKGVNFDADMHNLGYEDPEVARSEKVLMEKTFTGDKEKYFASSGKTMEQAIANFDLLAAKLDSLKAIGLVKSYTPTGKVFVPLKEQERRIVQWKAYWTPQKQAQVKALIRQTASAEGLNAEAFDVFFENLNSDYEPDAIYKAGIIPEGYLSTLMEESYGGDWLCFTSVRCANDSVHGDSTDYNRICMAVADQPNMMVLDTYYYTRDTLRQLNSDFNVLQWLSLLFVFVVLLVSFRFNLKHSLLGFMPIVLSWLIVLGAMAIFSMGFNLISIIISTFIFGIGVDYSIFVMNGLVSGGGEKLHYHKTAILLSAVILVITVGSMLFAKHPAILSVGFSTLVGLVSAVVLSYVVQPAIYRLINKK